MKKYNKNNPCQKCGATLIEDVYNNGLPKEKMIETVGSLPENFTPEETIKRTCLNCGYSWDEEPLNN